MQKKVKGIVMCNGFISEKVNEVVERVGDERLYEI